MSEAPKKTISVVTPAFNEAENLTALVERVRAVFEPLPYAFELWVIDDGGTDQSVAMLRQIHAKDPRVHYVSLSRNFGHQSAILTGLSYSRGAAVITMDADLQHPPEFIPQLIQEWEKGARVVNTRKENNSSGLLRKCIDRSFYGAMDRFLGLKLGQADFRLLDRQVVDELLKLPESEKFLRALIAWLGFRTAVVGYQVAPRFAGTAKFRFKHLAEMLVQGITAFSTVPLRMITALGFIFLIPSLLYIFYILYLALLLMITGSTPHVMPPGWATLSITIVFFGSIQLLALGIIGNYIGRIYLEAKRRPTFVVQDTSEK